MLFANRDCSPEEAHKVLTSPSFITPPPSVSLFLIHFVDEIDVSSNSLSGELPVTFLDSVVIGKNKTVGYRLLLLPLRN